MLSPSVVVFNCCCHKRSLSDEYTICDAQVIVYINNNHCYITNVSNKVAVAQIKILIVIATRLVCVILQENTHKTLVKFTALNYHQDHSINWRWNRLYRDTLHIERQNQDIYFIPFHIKNIYHVTFFFASSYCYFSVLAFKIFICPQIQK